MQLQWFFLAAFQRSCVESIQVEPHNGDCGLSYAILGTLNEIGIQTFTTEYSHCSAWLTRRVGWWGCEMPFLSQTLQHFAISINDPAMFGAHVWCERVHSTQQCVTTAGQCGRSILLRYHNRRSINLIEPLTWGWFRAWAQHLFSALGPNRRCPMIHPVRLASPSPRSSSVARKTIEFSNKNLYFFTLFCCQSTRIDVFTEFQWKINVNICIILRR